MSGKTFLVSEKVHIKTILLIDFRTSTRAIRQEVRLRSCSSSPRWLLSGQNAITLVMLREPQLTTPLFSGWHWRLIWKPWIWTTTEATHRSTENDMYLNSLAKLQMSSYARLFSTQVRQHARHRATTRAQARNLDKNATIPIHWATIIVAEPAKKGRSDPELLVRLALPRSGMASKELYSGAAKVRCREGERI